MNRYVVVTTFEVESSEIITLLEELDESLEVFVPKLRFLQILICTSVAAYELRLSLK